MSGIKLEDRDYVYLNEDYRVTSDSICFILQKRKVTQDTKRATEVGKEYWVDLAYHNNLLSIYDSALNSVVKENLSNLEKILKIVQDFRNELELKLSYLNGGVKSVG